MAPSPPTAIVVSLALDKLFQVDEEYVPQRFARCLLCDWVAIPYSAEWVKDHLTEEHGATTCRILSISSDGSPCNA